jgi:hypothetical protein
LIFVLWLVALPAQVTFESSYLPILVVTTANGTAIPNEPKIDAHLGIIWNGEGELNHLTDPFNHYDGKIGIEARGSSSQFLFPKKGYAVETLLPDGSNNNVSLFGFPAENDWVLHGPYSDKSLMRNALSYIVAGWLMEYAPRVRFCEVVIGGDYQGVYLFTEKIKRDDNRVNIATLSPDENTGDDLTGGYILKFDKWDGAFNDGFPSKYPPFPGATSTTTFQYHYPKPEDISPQQKDYLRNHIDAMEDVLVSPAFADPLTGYRHYFDLPAFYHFFFVQEMSRNVDGYRLSTFFYKDKDSKNGKWKMGPVWDFNLGYGNVNYCTGPGTSGWAIDFPDFCPNDFLPHFWWKRLWQDPAFLQEMSARWIDLRNDTLANDRIFHLIDSLEALLKAPAARNFKRWNVLGQYVWPNSYVGNTYKQEVDYLRNWLAARLAWMDKAMEAIASPVSVASDYVQPVVSPNPFRDELVFEYYVRSKDPVRIDIFNYSGQVVETLFDRQHPGGSNSLRWQSDLPAGIYFYRIWIDNTVVKAGKVVKN